MATENAGGSGTSSRTYAGAARWAVLLAAFLGWMFDGLEMGIFPQIARPAMTQLVPEPAGPYVSAALTAATAALRKRRCIGKVSATIPDTGQIAMRLSAGRAVPAAENLQSS